MRLAMAILLAYGALAQSLTTPQATAEARAALAPRPGERSLHCTAEPTLPILLYTAPEMAAGYTYSIPLSQYTNGRPPQGWSVFAAFKLQDSEAPPVYLAGHIDAPSTDKDTASGSAAYWMGLGTYTVLLALSDGQDRVCRKRWNVTVDRWPTSGKGHYGGGIFIPDGVDKFDLRTATFLSSKSALGTPDGVVRAPVRPGTTVARHSLTVLMSALEDPGSQLQTLDVLETLLARIPAVSVRLVVFSLAEGHEVYRQDGFELDSMGRVREALRSLGYRAVTVAELQRDGISKPAKLLDAVVQRETHEAQRSDAIIFVGMEFGNGAAFPFSVEPGRPIPPVFYLHLLKPAFLLGFAGLGGVSTLGQYGTLVSYAVRKLHGKTIPVASAQQFDHAVDQIRQSLEAGRR